MTSNLVYGILQRRLRSRRDLGMGKALLDMVFHPANPFDKRRRRTPRHWFVFFIFVSGMLLGCFLYFNNLS
jgi:drug/metabolite transporter (DMT)-like permease